MLTWLPCGRREQMTDQKFHKNFTKIAQKIAQKIQKSLNFITIFGITMENAFQ